MKRVNDLTDWHLERMAVHELGEDQTSTKDVELLQQDSQQMQQRIHQMLQNGKDYASKRETLIQSMQQQREGWQEELSSMKQQLQQLHTTEPSIASLHL